MVIFLMNVTHYYAYELKQFACNGSPLLASRRYNEVAYATTHNGQSYKNSLVQNQDRTITEQLEAGIRAIKIPLWYDAQNCLCACHGMSKLLFDSMHEQALLDQIPIFFRSKARKFLDTVRPAITVMQDALHVAYGNNDGQQGLIPFPHGMFDPACQPFKNICVEVRKFLETHSHEIVTFILENFTDNLALIAADIQESGLLDYVHTQDIQKPWPTLRELVRSQKRMIIFVSSGDKGRFLEYPWLMSLWDFAWDTRFNFTRIADFAYDCLPNRGKNAYEQRASVPHNKLFIVYHFITPFAGGSKSWAKRVNRVSVLKKRLQKLAQKTGHIPNFVQVDFFEYPHNDIFKVINCLNGVNM